MVVKSGRPALAEPEPDSTSGGTMQIAELPINPRAVTWNRRVEAVLNRVVRGKDRVLGRLGLGGRVADYDDEHYQFIGGANDEMRRKHYDKSLRLLWKAEAAAPWSTFHDLGAAEQALREMAELATSPAEQQVQMVMFLKNLALIGGLLMVAALGAGAYSLDRNK